MLNDIMRTNKTKTGKGRLGGADPLEKKDDFIPKEAKNREKIIAARCGEGDTDVQGTSEPEGKEKKKGGRKPQSSSVHLHLEKHRGEVFRVWRGGTRGEWREQKKKGEGEGRKEGRKKGKCGILRIRGPQ